MGTKFFVVLYIIFRNIRCLILGLFAVVSVTTIHAEDLPEAQLLPEPFSFALLGDMPYEVGYPSTSVALSELVSEINSDGDVEWTLHVGDFKGGSQPCDDDFIRARKHFFLQFRRPFLLTPGDNDWTDCHRPDAGHFDPLERLEFLREEWLRSQTDMLSERKIEVKSQGREDARYPDYVENILWHKNKVVFATVHLVGSGNGTWRFHPRSQQKRRQAHKDEVVDRTQAALAWIEEAFANAKKAKAKGLFIAMHANPGFPPHSKRRDRRPFEPVLEAIYKGCTDFAMPCVLAHGDSHTFRIDQPAYGKLEAPSNFLRIETFGDNDGPWVKVNVDPQAPAVFSFSPRVLSPEASPE